MAALVVVTAVLSLPAVAGTKEQLDEAKRDLAKVQGELQAATADWQVAERDLELTRHEISLTKGAIERLQRSVQRVQRRLDRRAVIAFQNGPGTTIDLLLSSESIADFSARLEFLGSMTQSDADLIVERDVAEEQLQRERDDLLRLEHRQAETADVFQRGDDDRCDQHIVFDHEDAQGAARALSIGEASRCTPYPNVPVQSSALCKRADRFMVKHISTIWGSV